MLQIFADITLQQFLQFPVHVFVIIADVKADHFFACYDIGILFRYPSQVLFLHTEDDVCPAEESGGDLDAGVLFCSRRAGLMPLETIEKIDFYENVDFELLSRNDDEAVMGYDLYR